MVSPTERSTYFKSLLEVTDLDSFRNDVESVARLLATSSDPYLVKLEKAKDIQEAQLPLLLTDLTDSKKLESAFAEASSLILQREGLEVPPNLELRIVKLRSRLAERRGAAFPLDGFRRSQLSIFAEPSEEEWQKVEQFFEERSRVDEQTQKLTTLFQTILTIPAYADTRKPLDCPLCETSDALTPARIEAIRTEVASTVAFSNARTAALNVLRALQSNLSRISNSIAGTAPRFLAQAGGERRRTGFTIERVRELLGDQFSILVPSWIGAILPLNRPQFSRHARAS